MKKLFGTDGMRGVAGRFPLDAATVRTAGLSLARHLAEQLGHPPRLVTGRDTRESGGWIESAIIEGARKAGASCESAGVVTTPGVAYLARTMPADCGIVISASHNPYTDNGIKLFSPTGRKLDEETERRIEADIYSSLDCAGGEVELSDGGFVSGDEGASSLVARYIDFLAEEVAAGLRLDGITVVADCANGAAYEIAPALLRRLGASVTTINNAPDGRNINRDCGSLHMEELRRRVVSDGAQFGVAFDGDADRALFVDERGDLVDGDATLWVLAKRMQERGELEGDAVVATVMSNLGLELALRERGVRLLRTDVGDKYVLDELLRTGASVGGEQSGHIIFPRVSLAGDGLITTVNLLRAMRETGAPLSALTAGFTRYPQVLVNVRVREKVPFEEVEELSRSVRDVESQLGESGRLLLRYSGTEPLARIMIEGREQDEIDRLAESLACVFRKTLGE